MRSARGRSGHDVAGIQRRGSRRHYRTRHAGPPPGPPEPGTLDRTVHLSFADVPGSEYLNQLITDLAIHGWDLARAIGADDTIDPALVDALLPYVEANADALAGSGMFAAPVPVSPDADAQTKLLAMMGRQA